MSLACEFAEVFRADANVGVEYSFDSSRDRNAVMVAGKPPFVERVQRFAARLPYAGDWAWAVRRFNDCVYPDAFLIRIDCQADEILAVTLYCRFPAEPTDGLFERAMSSAAPLKWGGPPPSAVAATLGVPGPRGISFRVDCKGSHKTALYYKVPTHTTDMQPKVLQELVRHCGFPDELASVIDGDIRTLYPPGPVGVVGVDSDEAGRASALKFDPANIPLRRVFAFVRGKGTPETRIAELAQVADSLRAMWASYLGVKYGSDGFVGWRVYFSVRPNWIPIPGTGRVVVERSEIPTLRLPHY